MGDDGRGAGVCYSIKVQRREVLACLCGSRMLLTRRSCGSECCSSKLISDSCGSSSNACSSGKLGRHAEAEPQPKKDEHREDRREERDGTGRKSKHSIVRCPQESKHSRVRT